MRPQTKRERTAIVTGAAGGIGRAICRALAEDWGNLALFDIDADRLAELAGELADCGVETLAVPVDLADTDAIAPAVAAVQERFGTVGGLVNNAGIIQLKALAETTSADFDLTVAINVRAPFVLIQQVVPDMIARGWGKIVSIGSSAGKSGGSGGQGAYGATKAALMCLTKSFARELGPNGVTVNSVSPALIETDMIKGLEQFAKSVPMQRLGQPFEVADAVAFLMSERAGFITGEDLDVNGGFLMD